MAEPEHGIEAQGVVRRFGALRALDGIDLSIPYGQVTALVGANGAGKTTLLLVLATLLAPDEGQIRVAGYDLRSHPQLAHEALGWMPDTFGVYDRLTAREYLQFFADAYRLPKADAAARIEELLLQMHLEEYAAQPVHVLSRGQKQRLGLARALVHRPKVLLLDEPASGLDPRSRVELRDLLRGLAKAGAAVLVSSHILSELEEIADRVVLVERGRVVGEHAMADLAGARLDAEGRASWRIRALRPETLTAGLRDVAHTPLPDGAEVGPLTEAEAAELLATLVAEGVQVVSYAPMGGGLESAYLAITEDRR